MSTKKEFPIEFTLTDAQKRALTNASAQRTQSVGKKEDAKVKIDGHITDDGKLYIKDLTVEFIHRWMDCTQPNTIK